MTIAEKTRPDTLELWVATPMLRLVRDKLKGEVNIEQMWVDQMSDRREWRSLPVVNVINGKVVN